MVELVRLMSVDAAGTYMLNTGQLALALVASGQLSAYINNYTNTWDVAAGAVLVEAVGGRVTDFSGRPIDYGTHTKVQVIAASDPAMHEELLRDVERCGGAAALVP
jgi:myo-inositol-1(or 4)-monophosphatase